MENLQELEEKQKLLELTIKEAERKEQAIIKQMIAEQKAVDDWQNNLAQLKAEYGQAVLSQDTEKRRELEIQIRTMEDRGSPSLPQAQVEAQTIADNTLKAEYATLTRMTPSGADQALQIKKRLNEIESELRKPKSINATFIMGR